MLLEVIIPVLVLGFILEFIDVSAGMGFGIITSILILMEFQPLEILPAVLMCGFIFGLAGGFFHQKNKNVKFNLKTKPLKIVFVLGGLGILGVFIGALVAINIPEFYLKLYIGLLILIMGVLLFIHKTKKRKFSWKRIGGLGLLASFDKGMAGGGYGPVLTGGQIMSGVNSKKAVGITTLTEGIVSLAGFLSFLTLKSSEINWILIGSLSAGGMLSIPLATYFVKKTESKNLKIVIASLSILLGLGLLVKIFI